MPRLLQPELLDSLPVEHPDARHNRRDLRRINALMGNHRWLARTLPPLLRPGESVLELGAGTGELGLRLAARGVAVDGLDVWPRPSNWPAGRTWHQADLRQFAGYDRYSAVIGNLIFHQFSDADLATLGRKLGPPVRVFVACEPVRRSSSQVWLRLAAPILGANHVTRHDGHVSIAAGFLDDELPRALGLTEGDWDCRCTVTTLGAYRLVALRRP